jgi:hypothetical protein
MEVAEPDAIVPDEVWLSYALCTVEESSCGWAGWIIESVWTSQGADKLAVSAADNQRCPNCGKLLFRTGLEKKYGLHPSQPLKLDFSYERLPETFEEKPTQAK